MKLSTIKPNPANPRTIKDERFEKLCRSIQEFPKMMELRPIVTDDQGVILGGNMRYRALQHLNMKEIPDNWVKRAAELTDEERRRFIVTDNVGFGDWDIDDLAANWDREELDTWGVEVDWPAEFDPNNIDFGNVDKKTSLAIEKCPKCGFEWQKLK